MDTDTKTPYTDISNRISEIFQRKVDKGIDCTEEESAVIKRYFDLVDPEGTLQGSAVALAFTTEHAEWDDELARGEEVRAVAAMRRQIEGLSDEDLEKELSFAEGFADDSSLNTIFWTEALRHESRCRGIFVPDVDTETIEEWMRDSDYLPCEDEDCADGPCGWVDLDDNGPYDPAETYAYAHQAMTWADVLENVPGA